MFRKRFSKHIKAKVITQFLTIIVFIRCFLLYINLFFFNKVINVCSCFSKWRKVVKKISLVKLADTFFLIFYILLLNKLFFYKVIFYCFNIKLLLYFILLLTPKYKFFSLFSINFNIYKF